MCNKLVGKTKFTARSLVATVGFTPVVALHLKQRLEHYFAFQYKETKIGLSETMGARFFQMRFFRNAHLPAVIAQQGSVWLAGQCCRQNHFVIWKHPGKCQ